jgi:iron complex outermembrane receptor protein
VSLDAPLTQDFALRVDRNLRRADDFDIRGFQQSGVSTDLKGDLVNSSIDNDSGSITGMLSQDWGYVGLGYSRWESDYGIPENFDPRPRNEGGQSDDFERIEADYDRFDLRTEVYNPFAGFSRARVNMSYTLYSQEEIEFKFDRTSAGGVLDERVVEAEFEKDVFESRFELMHNPIGGLVGVLGLEVSNTDFKAGEPGEPAGFYVRPNTVNTFAVFAVEELATDFGKLEFGARVGRERYSPDDVFGSEAQDAENADGNPIPFPEQLSSRNFTLASFSVGALTNIGSDHHLRSSLTTSERAPSSEQLYAFGRHGAAGTFEVGDPDLNKETYLNLELGVDRHAGAFRYDMSVFYNLVHDFIYLQSEDDGTSEAIMVTDTGSRNPVDGDLRNLFVRNEQADAEFFGIELGAEMDLDTGALPSNLRASADFVRGRLRSGGNLPRITPPRAGIGYDITWQNYSLSLDYQRVFRQRKTGQAEDNTSGYNLLGFDLAWKPAAVQNMRLFLNGRNLANQDGRRHQSFFKDDAPIIGRAFTAGVRYDFGG